MTAASQTPAPLRSPAVLPAPADGVTTDMATAVAESVGVCVRPILRTVTHRATHQVTAVPIPCGPTRSSVCPSCADKARRLRMQQCREGWHITEDPLPPESNLADPVDDVEEPEDEDADDEEASDAGPRRS